MLPPTRMIRVSVEKTMRDLLQSEDVDRDGLITVDDCGPKASQLNDLPSLDGYVDDIYGTYPLSVLLQELTFAKNGEKTTLDVDVNKLSENAKGITRAVLDPKAGADDSSRRIYVPRGAPEQFGYFKRLSDSHPSLQLDVQWLPEGDLTAAYIRSLNARPGLLALEMRKSPETKECLDGYAYIVPGGRFNELYNWDTVFCTWGMREDHCRAENIIRHFVFEIRHYGKVCNANRSYYLGRSQPPLLTDPALRTYEWTSDEPGAKDLLRMAIIAATEVYNHYWMTGPRYDEKTCLNRYRPIGKGFPPECEAGQFDHFLRSFAEKHQKTIPETTRLYNDGEIEELDVDSFCLHNRPVRECGYDTSNRVEGICADLATIDLQCLLYKYEGDIAYAIKTFFGDELVVPANFCYFVRTANRIETSATWERAASKRQSLINRYLWNEEKGLFVDFNTVTFGQTEFESVTSLWALWCGVASPHQAARLVEKGLPKFECIGGLSSTTEKTRGFVDANKHPQKQWDYPHGWAPHQMLAWEGLRRYGFHKRAEKLIYRWLYMIVNVFRDYKGTVVEKYNVTTLDAPHKVSAEYGNQGVGFTLASDEGYDVQTSAPA